MKAEAPVWGQRGSPGPSWQVRVEGGQVAASQVWQQGSSAPRTSRGPRRRDGFSRKALALLEQAAHAEPQKGVTLCPACASVTDSPMPSTGPEGAVLPSFSSVLTFLYFFFSFFFLSFMAAPAAYGSSQARGRMGAVAASLPHSHSHAESEPRL